MVDIIIYILPVFSIPKEFSEVQQLNAMNIEDDEGYYLALAAQSVLLNYQANLSLDPHEILDLSRQIRREALLFRKASNAMRESGENGHKKLKLILAHLRDEHLIQSYTEAMRLELESDFIELLRSEILRRGIHSLVD